MRHRATRFGAECVWHTDALVRRFTPTNELGDRKKVGDMRYGQAALAKS